MQKVWAWLLRLLRRWSSGGAKNVMSFPQTTPVNSVRGGEEYWRLLTPLSSSGDIYEAEVSARAIVVGPDSDISKIDVTYYDVQNPNLANTASVSTDKPFIGRLDAFASENYQSGDRARVLISTSDLLPPAGFRPQGAGVADPLSIIQPNIDLLFYLNEEPTFIAPRTNTTYRTEQNPVDVLAPPNWVMFPFYGRRYANITMKNVLDFVTPTTVVVNVYGINFSNIISDPGLQDNGHQQELLATTTIVPFGVSGVTQSIQITNRAFDYLALSYDPSVAFPTRTSFVINAEVSDSV
jgi:hypothetical protein